jgi:hypothetical protein
MATEQAIREEERPYVCRGCARVLGLCTANVLTIGDVAFKRIVSFACVSCGRRHTWAPVDMPRQSR